MKLKLLAAMLIVAPLVGCGGGSGEDEATTVPADKADVVNVPVKPLDVINQKPDVDAKDTLYVPANAHLVIPGELRTVEGASIAAVKLDEPAIDIPPAYDNPPLKSDLPSTITLTTDKDGVHSQVQLQKSKYGSYLEEKAEEAAQEELAKLQTQLDSVNSAYSTAQCVSDADNEVSQSLMGQQLDARCQTLLESKVALEDALGLQAPALSFLPAAPPPLFSFFAELKPAGVDSEGFPIAAMEQAPVLTANNGTINVGDVRKNAKSDDDQLAVLVEMFRAKKTGVNFHLNGGHKFQIVREQQPNEGEFNVPGFTGKITASYKVEVNGLGELIDQVRYVDVVQNAIVLLDTQHKALGLVRFTLDPTQQLYRVSTLDGNDNESSTTVYTLSL